MNRSLALAACAVLGLSAAMLAQKTEIPPEARLIESVEGPDLYRAYCASCHGLDAKGNGPVASSLSSKPADLTRISARNGGRFPSLKIQQIIGGQAAVVVSHGNREMPVWGPIFSQVARDQDFGTLRIFNLAKYLESLQK